MIFKIYIIEYKCVWSGERQTKNLQSGIRWHSWNNERKIIGEEERFYHYFTVSISKWIINYTFDKSPVIIVTTAKLDG